ncbi:hypothetical protein K438DRAFT_1777982 [Mycena galopus ATCC 62051]|nr:hypothetical protein K438DRAFT_1777982 [Mycena galopus ATCC 62051]
MEFGGDGTGRSSKVGGVDVHVKWDQIRVEQLWLDAERGGGRHLIKARSFLSAAEDLRALLDAQVVSPSESQQSEQAAEPEKKLVAADFCWVVRMAAVMQVKSSDETDREVVNPAEQKRNECGSARRSLYLKPALIESQWEPVDCDSTSRELSRVRFLVLCQRLNGEPCQPNREFSRGVEIESQKQGSGGIFTNTAASGTRREPSRAMINRSEPALLRIRKRRRDKFFRYAAEALQRNPRMDSEGGNSWLNLKTGEFIEVGTKPWWEFDLKLANYSQLLLDIRQIFQNHWHLEELPSTDALWPHCAKLRLHRVRWKIATAVELLIAALGSMNSASRPASPPIMPHVSKITSTAAITRPSQTSPAISRHLALSDANDLRSMCASPQRPVSSDSLTFGGGGRFDNIRRLNSMTKQAVDASVADVGLKTFCADGIGFKNRLLEIIQRRPMTSRLPKFILYLQVQEQGGPILRHCEHWTKIYLGHECFMTIYTSLQTISAASLSLDPRNQKIEQDQCIV